MGSKAEPCRMLVFREATQPVAESPVPRNDAVADGLDAVSGGRNSAPIELLQLKEEVQSPPQGTELDANTHGKSHHLTEMVCNSSSYRSAVY